MVTLTDMVTVMLRVNKPLDRFIARYKKKTAQDGGGVHTERQRQGR